MFIKERFFMGRVREEGLRGARELLAVVIQLLLRDVERIIILYKLVLEVE